MRALVTSNIEALSKGMVALGGKDLQTTLMFANFNTAKRVKAGVLDVMARRFDNPTKTTMNSLYIKTGSNKNPDAKVWFKDAFSHGIAADKYLQAQVFGGERRHKRFDKALIAHGFMKSSQYAIPVPSVLDGNGNIKGGLVMKIMSGLSIAENRRGATSNASNGARSKKKGNAKRYFVGDVGGRRGVWENIPGRSGGRVYPVMLFADDSPKYKVRLPFFKIAENIHRAHYLHEFTSSMDKTIAKRRAK